MLRSVLLPLGFASLVGIIAGLTDAKPGYAHGVCRGTGWAKSCRYDHNHRNGDPVNIIHIKNKCHKAIKVHVEIKNTKTKTFSPYMTYVVWANQKVEAFRDPNHFFRAYATEYTTNAPISRVRGFMMGDGYAMKNLMQFSC